MMLHSVKQLSFFENAAVKWDDSLRNSIASRNEDSLSSRPEHDVSRTYDSVLIWMNGGRFAAGSALFMQMPDMKF
jgi:hypothetical protein